MNKNQFRKYLDKKYRKEGIIDQMHLHELTFKDEECKEVLLDIFCDNVTHSEYLEKNNPNSVNDEIKREIKVIPFIYKWVIPTILILIGIFVVLIPFLIKQNKTYKLCTSTPDTIHGTLLVNEVRDNTHFLFSAKKYSLDKEICIKHDSQKECVLSVRTIEKKYFLFFKKREISITGKFYNKANVLIGEMINNEFTYNNECRLRFKYDNKALEIFDITTDEVLLQIAFTNDEQSILVNGFFYSKSHGYLVSNQHDDFHTKHFGGKHMSLNWVADLNIFNSAFKDFGYIRPIFYHDDSFDPKGTRIPRQFNQRLKLKSSGNTILVIDDNLNFEDKQFNVCVENMEAYFKPHLNIQFKDYMFENKITWKTNKQSSKSRFDTLSSKMSSKYDFMLFVTKENDGTSGFILSNLDSLKYSYQIHSSSKNLFDGNFPSKETKQVLSSSSSRLRKYLVGDKVFEGNAVLLYSKTYGEKKDKTHY